MNRRYVEEAISRADPEELLDIWKKSLTFQGGQRARALIENNLEEIAQANGLRGVSSFREFIRAYDERNLNYYLQTHSLAEIKLLVEESRALWIADFVLARVLEKARAGQETELGLVVVAALLKQVDANEALAKFVHFLEAFDTQPAHSASSKRIVYNTLFNKALPDLQRANPFLLRVLLLAPLFTESKSYQQWHNAFLPITLNRLSKSKEEGTRLLELILECLNMYEFVQLQMINPGLSLFVDSRLLQGIVFWLSALPDLSVEERQFLVQKIVGLPVDILGRVLALPLDKDLYVSLLHYLDENLTPKLQEESPLRYNIFKRVRDLTLKT